MNLLARERAVQRFQREQGDPEGRIIEAIQRAGPRNISELSRITGVHPETIRYKINRRFTRLGFHIHAEADYRKLGLVPYWAVISVSRKSAETPRSLFLALNRSAYLVYYGKQLPHGNFVCLFVIPEGKEKKHRALLSSLKESDHIRAYSMVEIVASRHPTMQPHYFNFQSNRWDIDWNQVDVSKGTELKIQQKSPVEAMDYIDLLLLKELQVSALQHTVAIARKVKLNEKTAEYHYRAHVQKKKLISGYLIRWQRDMETSVSHRTLLTRLTFSDLGERLGLVQRTISKIPFLWEEDLLADGTFVATVHIPVEETTSFFDFLSTRVPELYGHVEVALIKRSEASAFTVPYQMYRDGWKYNVTDIINSIETKKEGRAA